MTLTIQDLGALGELLGSVTVLATLVSRVCSRARRWGNVARVGFQLPGLSGQLWG